MVARPSFRSADSCRCGPTVDSPRWNLRATCAVRSRSPGDFSGWVPRGLCIRQSALDSPDGSKGGHRHRGQGLRIRSFPRTANGSVFSVVGGNGTEESARPWRHTGADRRDIRAARRRNLASGWHDRVRHQRGPVSGVRERWRAAASGETGSRAEGTRLRVAAVHARRTVGVVHDGSGRVDRRGADRGAGCEHSRSQRSC